MLAQNKTVAELGAQRPQKGKGNVISFQLYYNRRRAATVRTIASFVGTNSDFKRYLREGEVTAW